MLSKTTRRLIIYLTQVGDCWSAIPISWDSKLSQFTSSAISFKRWSLQFSLWLMNLSYLTLRLIILLYDDATSFNNFEPFWKVFFSIFLFVSVTVMFFNTGNKRCETVSFTNQWFKLTEFFQEHYFPNFKDSMHNGCESVMKILMAFVFACPLGILDYIIHPTSFIYATSIFKDNPILLSIFYIPYGILLFKFFVSCSIPGIFMVFVNLPVVIIAGRMFSEMKPNITGHKYSSRNSLREPNNLFHTYRCYQLLFTKVNSIVRMVVMPLYTIQSYCIIISAVVVIRFHMLNVITKMILIIVALSMVAEWSVVLYFSGLVFKKSKQTIDYWKRTRWGKHKDRKLIKQLSKSCRPVQLNFGSFYSVKIVRVLMFIHFSILGTLRGLLILK